MRWAFLFLSCCSVALNAAGPGEVRTVYVLPMSHSLDQFLANRLTAEQVLDVVTDAKRADAIFTDRIGAAFETRLQDLLPPAAPAKPKDAKAAKDEKAEKADDKGQPAGFMGGGGFGGGRGTVFLVDVKTRQVLWSTYQQPKDFSPGQLDRTAQKIVTQLKNHLNGRK